MEHFHQKLSFREKAGYSLGDGAANLVFQVLMAYQFIFFTTILGLSPKAADPNVYAVNAMDDLSWMTVDDWNIAGLHYDTQGQVNLGERFAQAIITGLTEDAYASWREATFSNPSAPNTERPDDFDGDGYSNEFEYFMGMDPEDAGNQAPNKQPVSASIVTASDDYLAITYTYRTDTPDIRYAICSSTNLKDWTDKTASMIQVGSVTDNADGTATQTLRYPWDIKTSPSLFLQFTARKRALITREHE